VLTVVVKPRKCTVGQTTLNPTVLTIVVMPRSVPLDTPN